MGRSSAEATAPAPPPEPAQGSEWLSDQVRALATAWERGERITAEELLKCHPGLDTVSAVRLVYEEVCLRREAGEEVKTTEVLRRFPQWRDELELLMGCDRLLRPTIAETEFPEIGESLGPFELLAELGRGASGVTFLAAEPTLADRTVVLKVIPSDQQEHLTLARLQHTHIVPLFSEQVFPERGLRALCMPYLGGASLAQVLSELTDVPPPQRRGRHLVEVIDRIAGPAPTLRISDSPFRRFFEQASYEQAITLIAACLADALHYAHARGLLHMDVKPSNVLITGDGQPLLLDFHLARGPVPPGERGADRLGGTTGWMAPEQQAAMQAIRLGQPVTQAVDCRADVYALGLLLRETLGSSGVSVGLADIIAKCLAPEPAGRYRDAATLADDLRRHLNDLPMQGVGNRSLAERWRKWRRRRPGALASGVAIVTVLVAVAVLGAAYLQRVQQMEIALEDGRKLQATHQYPEAIRTLQRGKESAALIPGVGRLTEALQAQLRLAIRGQKAMALHDLADLIRFRYGIALPSREEAAALERDWTAIWEERNQLIGPNADPLGPESESQIKTDFLELAIVKAALRVQRAAPDAAAEARTDALRRLNAAESAFGPSLALDDQRRRLSGTEQDAGPEPTPRTPWEHYDLGRSFLRSGRFEAAAAEFQSTLDQRPQDLWSNFFQGLCAYRLGHFEDAVAAFRTAIALAPNAAPPYYNRGMAYNALGQDDQALRDYDRAIGLDPNLAPALLNRGILSYKKQRYREAAADFRRALSATSDRETLGQAHFNLALVLQAQGDRASALSHAETAFVQGCGDAKALCDDLRKGR